MIEDPEWRTKSRRLAHSAGVKPVNGRWASDHFGVVVDLEIRKG
jgi:endonuclease/exonuclease/phosphatase family metal-dependent hydrolase